MSTYERALGTVRSHAGRGPVWGSILGLAFALPAVGQQEACDGHVRGDFGLASAGCSGGTCVLSRVHDGRRDDGSNVYTWVYSIEPDVESVRPGSPLDGVLRPGDRIVSVDGIPITTREGSRRLERPEPGDVIVLAYRRNGRLRETEVRAEAYCATDEDEVRPGLLRDRMVLRAESLLQGVRSLVEPGRVSEADPEAATQVPAVGRPTRTAAPRVHLGMTFECDDCSIHTSGGAVRWSFSQPPRVLRVEADGPANRAGLRAGDLIRRVGGYAIESREGGEAFGALTPGTPVRVVVSRPDGSVANLSLTPASRDPATGARVDREGVTRAAASGDEGPLRFSGTLGDAALEVRGGPVTVDHLEGEGLLVIYTESNVIRIRIAPGGEP